MVRRRKSEDGSPKTEVRRRKSGDGSPKMEETSVKNHNTKDISDIRPSQTDSEPCRSAHRPF